MEIRQELSSLGNGWESLPETVIFKHILNRLTLHELIQMSGSNRSWRKLASQAFKPIVLEYISPLKEEPTSWFEVFANLRCQLKDFKVGKSRTPISTQEKVDHLLPYGTKPSEIPNSLLLITEGGKKIKKWDSEGGTATLWCSETPFTPTEIVWGKNGPELLLFDPEGHWHLLCLNHPEKNRFGKEKTWAPQDLSPQYLSLARGRSVGVWGDTNGKPVLQPGMPPIPFYRREDPTPHFLLQLGYQLLVTGPTRDSNEPLATLVTYYSLWKAVPPLVVQPTPDSPIFLVYVDAAQRCITIRNTDDWSQGTACRTLLDTFDQTARNCMQYCTRQERHWIVWYAGSFFWLLEFDPKTGLDILFQCAIPSPNSPMSTPSMSVHQFVNSCQMPDMTMVTIMKNEHDKKSIVSIGVELLPPEKNPSYGFPIYDSWSGIPFITPSGKLVSVTLEEGTLHIWDLEPKGNENLEKTELNIDK